MAPDMTALASALAALKGAKDIAQAMIGLRDAAAFQSKMIEFQAKIIEANNSAFAAQEERSALLQRISQLETDVARIKAWEAEKQRYQLTDFGGGTFAYVLKPEASGAEPPHRICAACYQQGHKSILQFRFKTTTQQDRYVCPACKTEFDFGERRPPPQRSMRVIRSGW